MEALTILLPPKENPAVYYLLRAYLYIASISLFKYLITCLPIKVNGYTSFPQFASYTNLPLPLHKTRICFQNAEMTHCCSACSEASFNDCLRNQNVAEPHSCAAPTIGILLCQQNRMGPLRRQCPACLRDSPAHLCCVWGPHDGGVGGAVMPYRGIVEPCYCAINIFAIIMTEYHSTAITLYRLKYSTSKIILSIILVKIVKSPVMTSMRSIYQYMLIGCFSLPMLRVVYETAVMYSSNLK